MKAALTVSAALAALLVAACAEPAATDAGASSQTDIQPVAEAPADASAEATSEAMAVAETVEADAAPLCEGFGPQTPRDISNPAGVNPVSFPMAPGHTELNLCNIHSHTNAEHKGPGFSVFVGDDEHGGYACNETAELTEAELTDPTGGEGAFGHVAPGDTIEVHWVFSSCPVQPGEGLGACQSEGCDAPLLRVEAQSFLVVNDPSALDFTSFDYAGAANEAGLHQPLAVPTGSGDPVEFLGSTTGPSYTEQVCSPLQVTWSVRPQCLKVDISSLHRWAEANAFGEDHSHGVRQLVTAPELLSPIE